MDKKIQYKIKINRYNNINNNYNNYKMKIKI